MKKFYTKIVGRTLRTLDIENVAWKAVRWVDLIENLVVLVYKKNTKLYK